MAEQSPTPGNSNDPKALTPYESVLDAVVKKIQNELFLFIIGIGILLVALTVLAAGSPDVRFIAILFSLIVFLGMVLYFVGPVLQRGPRQPAKQEPVHKQRLSKILGSKQSRNFWESITNAESRIVIGRFRNFQAFEQSGLIGVGTAMALMEMQTFFRLLDFPDIRMAYADNVNGEELRNNLIILGGPDANSLANDVISKINTTLQFGDPSINEISFFDAKEGKTYAPTYGARSDEIDKDYAVIIRTANPFNPTKQVLLIAGSFGYGTWAASRFLTSEQFLSQPDMVREKSFEILLETDVVRGSPQDTRLILKRKLGY